MLSQTQRDWGEVQSNEGNVKPETTLLSLRRTQGVMSKVTEEMLNQRQLLLSLRRTQGVLSKVTEEVMFREVLSRGEHDSNGDKALLI